MAETLTLASPIVTPDRTTYEVVLTSFDKRNQRIVITLLFSDNTTRDIEYTGPGAINKMKVLNKSNFSVKSMEKTIMEFIQADYPELAGTISGAPD